MMDAREIQTLLTVRLAMFQKAKTNGMWGDFDFKKKPPAIEKSAHRA